MDVCLVVSAISPGCDCHDDQSVDESFVTYWWSPFAQMSLDPHQQQVALAVAVQVVAELAVAHQLRDQLPSVFRDWRHKEWVFARLHQGAHGPECPKLTANCLSRETVSPTSDTWILETVMMIHWRNQRVCRVCVSCPKFDDSALVERRQMWSKFAKIGSTDFLVSRASPKRNR